MASGPFEGHCAWCGDPFGNSMIARGDQVGDTVCAACDVLLPYGSLRMDVLRTGNMYRWRIAHLPSGQVVEGEDVPSYYQGRRSALVALVQRLRARTP